MIIVDERQFLAQELENKGFQVFDFYDRHQVLSLASLCQMPLQKRAEILLVDTQTVLLHPELKENFITILNTFLGVVFFHEQQNQAAQQWVEAQGAFLTKIVGEYALPMPQLSWTILSNQLQFFWSILQEQKLLQQHLSQFSQELDQLLKTAESEMHKAKKVHDILLPKRSDEIKGVQFFHKYTVGDGGGGEFYDMFHLGNVVYQVLISSQSYLISSALMGILNQEKPKFATASFLQLAQAEIKTINEAKKKKSDVEVSILEIDLSQLSLRVLGWGKPELYSQNKGMLRLEPQEQFQLMKGEKIIVISPGFLFNWKEDHVKQDLATFIKSHEQLVPQDLLMELFFELRQNEAQDISHKDATVVVIEVNRHGIHKV